jgi:hypothetical protein
MAQDIYAQMRRELISLCKILRKKSKNSEVIHRKVQAISKLALQLQGGVKLDIEQFEGKIDPFLKGELPPNDLFKSALKVQQETREL